MKRTTFFRILFILYLAALCYLCFGTFSSLPSVGRTFFGIEPDKIVHFAMFLPFTVLFFYSFKPKKRSGRSWLFIASFLLAVLFAAGTEWIQSYLPTRACDAADFLADSVGITLCTVFVGALEIARK